MSYVRTVKHKEQVRTLGLANKGRIPWNKGKKTGMKPWLGKKRPDIAGENHYLWKGDNVGYSKKHERIYKLLGQPSKCENCDTADSPRFEWANLSGEYKLTPDDWARLCARCHRLIDGNYGRKKYAI